MLDFNYRALPRHCTFAHELMILTGVFVNIGNTIDIKGSVTLNIQTRYSFLKTNTVFPSYFSHGLSSFNLRLTASIIFFHFRLYEKYVCKRVPGKQAVLVLHCDNTHVDEHMMVEPGLVMIFAHGIE